MPSFLDLSNENLYQIINSVHPNDILNFSLSSKWVYLLCKGALEEHKSWGPAYTHLVVHGCHGHQDDCHPLRLIRDICMDWRIGEFPKSLRVECCGIDEGEDGVTDGEDSDIEDEIEKTKDRSTIQVILKDIECYIKEKAVALGYLSNSETDDLCSLMREGYRAATIGLLLLFLPNLESISFQAYSWNASVLSNIVNTIAGQDLRMHHPRPRALTKLSCVKVLGLGNDYEGEDFEFLVPFAALPSMRTLFGRLVGLAHDDLMVLPFGLRVSNVTEIILHQSAVAVEPLTRLFSGINSLKRFTYKHTRVLHDRYPMKSHKIIGALLEHASNSLNYLALTGYCDPHEQEEDDHYNKGSLQGFKSLKVAFLHSAIYVDQVPYDGSSPDPDGGIFGDRLQDAIRPLVDVLPPSIETLQLIGRNLTDHLEGLLANLSKQKDLRLSKLRSITILLSGHESKCYKATRKVARVEERSPTAFQLSSNSADLKYNIIKHALDELEDAKWTGIEVTHDHIASTWRTKVAKECGQESSAGVQSGKNYAKNQRRLKSQKAKKEAATTPSEPALPQESATQDEAAKPILGLAAFGQLQQALQAASNDTSSQGQNPAILTTQASYLPATPFDLAIRKDKD